MSAMNSIMRDPEFIGRVALVTGAASGIGRATAIAFAAAGVYGVVLADLNVEGMQETAEDVESYGAVALIVPTDVSDPAEVQHMVSQTVESFGRLDFAFNNAGVEATTAATADISLAAWERTLAINLTGTWLCMRAEIPHVLASSKGAGAIVNCSSVAGLVGFAGSAGYVASKHGVVGLTRAAALDYATSGIRVNAVCPGVIATPMVERVIAGNPSMEAALTGMEPVGRMGTPEEIAAAVVWLCSSGSSFITGQAIAVDGGFVAR